jgi:hypothetical protein
VKSPENVPNEAAKDIKEALMKPGQNYGKDRYTIDLTGTEATYWLGTESGLLGAFQFDGACTAGDGSCELCSEEKERKKTKTDFTHSRRQSFI